MKKPVVFVLGMLGLAVSPALHGQGLFIRGDCDQDSRVDITDPLYALNFLFSGGREPLCFDACDADDSETFDIADGVYLLQFLFGGGPPPTAPYPDEGTDPSRPPPASLELHCPNGLTPPESLLVAPRRVLLYRLGETLVLEVAAFDADGRREDVRAAPTLRYSSDAPDIVSVSAAGVLSARAIGDATVAVVYRTLRVEVPVTVFRGADGEPVVTITSPPDRSVVTARRVILSGVVDDIGAALRLERTVSDDTVFKGTVIENRGGLFHSRVELEPGENILEVIATSDAGEGRGRITVIRREPGSPDAVGPTGEALPRVPDHWLSDPDTEPPVVAVSSPSAGAVLASAWVEVMGTVDDPTADVTVNGMAARLEDGRFRSVIELPPGPSTLRVEAVDPLGNRAARELPVVVDTAGPRLTVLEPSRAATIVVGDGSFRLAGEVQPRGATVRVGGQPAVVQGSFWHRDVSFGAGVHDLIVTAEIGPPVRSPGGAVARAQVVRSLVVDQAAPWIEIVFPPESRLLSPGGYRVSSRAVWVVGRIVERGGVPRELDGPGEVTVAGRPVTLAGDTFSAEVSLSFGVNRIEVTATDARGNRRVVILTVERRAPLTTQLVLLGDVYRTARAGEPARDSFIVQLLEGNGRPLVRRAVQFELSRGDGLLAEFRDGPLDGFGRRQLQVLTDARGRASVSFMGFQAGRASHVVTVSSRETDELGAFVIGVEPGTARVLVVHDRAELLGPAGLELARPLSVRLLDGSGNEIRDEDVEFRVVEGAAEFMDGERTATRRTGLAGVASIRARLPAVEGRSVVEASHSGAEPVHFTLFGRRRGPVADTSITGAVTDERGRLIAGVPVTLVGVEEDPSQATSTRTDGGFTLRGVPSGEVLLRVASQPGVHSGADRKLTIVSGRSHSIGSVRVASLRADGRQRTVFLAPGRGRASELPGWPEFRLELQPESVVIPGGGAARGLFVTAPHLLAIPAPAPDAIHPLGLFGIFPAAARFDQAARLAVPNFDGRPGERLALFQYRAAAGGFVELPGGVVDARAAAIHVDLPPEIARGGFYFFARAGPAGDERGTVSGRVRAVRPGWSEVPQVTSSPGSPGSAVLGYQVYAHSGELFVDEVDLAIPGRGLAYRFRRRYESRHRFRGALGEGWEHEYEDRRIHPALGGGNIIRASGTGAFDEYLYDARRDRFVSPPGVFARLFRDAEGFLVERTRDGTRYRYFPLDGDARAGRLESISDPSGNQLRFTRTARGLIATVHDPMGREIVYEQDTAGRIVLVTDHSGRRLQFEYDDRGDLVAVTGPEVTGTSTGNNFPAGRRTEYVYTAGHEDERLNHNLTQIIDPRQVLAGKTPRITVRYGEAAGADDFDRVIAQAWGDGSVAEFAYRRLRSVRSGGEDTTFRTALELENHLLGALDRTEFVDPRGHRTIVTSSGAGLPLARRVETSPDLDRVRSRDPARLHPEAGVAPGFYETRWTWTREGLLASVTRAGGDRLVYTYDVDSPLRTAQANLLEMRHVPAPGGSTEAAPATWSYRRDPLFGRVIERVSPRGFVTRRFLDYQEGTSSSVLAARAGCDISDLEEALERAGVQLDSGDLNADGVVDQHGGHVVREESPLVPRTDGSLERWQTLLTYNRFGQLLSRRDGDGRLVRFEYHPETDPEGDGVPATSGELDSRTGGLLAREIVETTAAPLVTEYRYDRWGSLAEIRDARGNSEFVSHNALGELVEERLPAPFGYRRQHLYDADGNVVTVRLENHTSTDSGAHVLVSENRWLETSVEYDLLSRPVRIRREVLGGEDGEERSVVTELRYDAAGHLNRRIDAVASTGGEVVEESWLHDERGLVIQHTHGAGTPSAATFTIHRNEQGEPVLLVDAADTDGDGEAERRELRYDGFQRLIAEIDSLGGTRVYERDLEGRKTLEAFLGSAGGPSESAGGDVGLVLLERTTWDHDAAGRVREMRWSRLGAEPFAGPSGNGQTDEVDSERAPLDALVSRFWYDSQGRLLRHEDARGVRRFEYGAAGRLVTRIESTDTLTTDTVTTFLRDPNGNCVKEVRETFTAELIGPTGTEDSDYDADGQFREVREVVRVFDALDRLTLLVDPAGGVWRTRYDAAGNLILVMDTVGPSVNPSTDPELAPVLELVSDRLRNRLNAPGNRRRYRYDHLGRLIGSVHELRRGGSGGGAIDVTNPYLVDGLIVETYRYDDLGRLYAWTDGDGRETRVGRDAAGHVTSKTWPDGAFETYERDRDGHLHVLEDAAGTRIIQRLDARGRVVERRVERAEGIGGTTLQRFQYDGLSRLTFAFDNNDPDRPFDDTYVLQRFDSLGHVVEEMQNGLVVRSSYDPAGRLLSRRQPDGRTFVLERDAAGRLTALSDGATLYAGYRHFGSGALLSKTLWNGLRIDFTNVDHEQVTRKSGYDQAGDVVEQIYRRGSGEMALGFEYEWNRKGHPRYELPLHRGERRGKVWRYDSVHRLVRYLPNVFNPRSPELNPLEKLVFHHDGNHNWRLVQVDFSRVFLSVNERNQFTASGEDEYSYDAAGNFKTGGAVAFVYDAFRRLLEVRRNGELIVRNVYDSRGAQRSEDFRGAGRRVAKEIFVPVRGQAAGRLDFVYAGRELVEERPADGGTRQLIWEDAGGERRPAFGLWTSSTEPPVVDGFLHDAFGSVAAVVDRAGEIRETVTYGAHGRPGVVSSTGGRLPFSSRRNAIAFAGLYHDFEIGMHLVGARHFDPQLGRYLSEEDRMFPGAPLTMNPYLRPALPGLVGEVSGSGSRRGKADYLEPMRVRVPPTYGLWPEIWDAPSAAKVKERIRALYSWRSTPSAGLRNPRAEGTK